MPYRRLPNTDASRLKALKIAYKKGKELPPFKLAFSQSTFQKVQSFLPNFEKLILNYKSSYANQVDKNKDYLKELQKARLYISHFIQVMNMAIARGELKSSTRKYFNLDENDKKLPRLNTEADIISWGKILIEGENNRKLRGLTPINNPTIAVVKVRYEKFLEAYNFQKTLQKANNRYLNNLSETRAEADKIILSVWNEVEKYFEDNPENQRREKAKEYGLIYVFRKNELKNLPISSQTEHPLHFNMGV